MVLAPLWHLCPRFTNKNKTLKEAGEVCKVTFFIVALKLLEQSSCGLEEAFMKYRTEVYLTIQKSNLLSRLGHSLQNGTVTFVMVCAFCIAYRQLRSITLASAQLSTI